MLKKNNNLIRVLISNLLALISSITWIALEIQTFKAEYEFLSLEMYIITLVFTIILSLLSLYIISYKNKLLTFKHQKYIDVFFFFQLLPMAVGFMSCYILDKITFIIYLSTIIFSIIMQLYMSVFIYKIIKNVGFDNQDEVRISKAKDINVLTTSMILLIIVTYILITLLGKHIVTIIITCVLLSIIVIIDIKKLKMAEELSILTFKKNFIIEMVCCLISIIIVYIFSDSNLLDTDTQEFEMTLNQISVIAAIIILVPIFKNNKKIGEFGLNNIK